MSVEQSVVDAYKSCRADLLKFVTEKSCFPLMVRAAWHDSGNFHKDITEWPACGGANGSIRFAPEINYGANAGLSKGLDFLKAFKEKYPAVSWADLIQMGSACSIEAAGGPKIPMRYGRVDAADSSACPEETSRGTSANAGLPDAMGPFGCGAPDAATHLRNIFGRMGFDDEGIVALSGAHTLGRAFKNRSGTVENAEGEENATNYTKSGCPIRHDGSTGSYMPGGKSWTQNWLTFDNSYFKTLAESEANPDLIRFPTDEALFQDPGFRPHFERFGSDQEEFFRSYAKAHKQLSELGSKFEPASGFELSEESLDTEKSDDRRKVARHT